MEFALKKKLENAAVVKKFNVDFFFFFGLEGFYFTIFFFTLFYLFIIFFFLKLCFNLPSFTNKSYGSCYLE